MPAINLSGNVRLADEPAPISGTITIGIVDSKIERYVNAWLAAHPDVTTTIQDGEITKAKMSASYLASRVTFEVIEATEDIGT